MQRVFSRALLGLVIPVLVFSAACGDSTGSGSTTTAGNGGNGGTGASNTGGSGTAGAGAGVGASGGGTGANGGGTAASGGGTGASGAGTTTGTMTSTMHIEVACVNQTYLCGDTLDNDGDGLIDADDPDCLGPCDNTENGYYGGIPGQAGPACIVDCYFDANSGAGNDECYWNHQCDPNEQTDPGHPEPNVDCPYNPNANTPGTNGSCAELSMTQSDTCATVCGPLTPNGCDCFGCCELPAGTGKFVWLGSEDNVTGEGSCSIAGLGDPTKCEPCVPVPGCYNGCEKCELCIGKTEVPPECNPVGTGGSGGTGGGMGGAGGTGAGAGGGGTGQCPAGIQACGLPGQAQCPAEFYCITGCCQPVEVPK